MLKAHQLYPKARLPNLCPSPVSYYPLTQHKHMRTYPLSSCSLPGHGGGPKRCRQLPQHRLSGFQYSRRPQCWEASCGIIWAKNSAADKRRRWGPIRAGPAAREPATTGLSTTAPLTLFQETRKKEVVDMRAQEPLGPCGSQRFTPSPVLLAHYQRPQGLKIAIARALKPVWLHIPLLPCSIHKVG